MLPIILWSVLALLIIGWILLFVRIRKDQGIWKTKKDFSFDEIDKLLESQDYKFEISKYLHKYKSDRRWYENHIALEIVVLVVATLLILADVIFIMVL
jgi:hypothetical protein